MKRFATAALAALVLAAAGLPAQAEQTFWTTKTGALPKPGPVTSLSSSNPEYVYVCAAGNGTQAPSPCGWCQNGIQPLNGPQRFQRNQCGLWQGNAPRHQLDWLPQNWQRPVPTPFTAHPKPPVSTAVPGRPRR